jgi:hypothetical protein
MTSEIETRIRAADQRAQRCGLAFALSKFDEYLAGETTAAQKRLEALYADLGKSNGRVGDAGQSIPAGDPSG